MNKYKSLDNDKKLFKIPSDLSVLSNEDLKNFDVDKMEMIDLDILDDGKRGFINLKEINNRKKELDDTDGTE